MISVSVSLWAVEKERACFIKHVFVKQCQRWCTYRQQEKAQLILASLTCIAHALALESTCCLRPLSILKLNGPNFQHYLWFICSSWPPIKKQTHQWLCLRQGRAAWSKARVPQACSQGQPNSRWGAGWGTATLRARAGPSLYNVSHWG